MTRFAYCQVDVFTQTALKGNPLGVVIGADDFTSEQMAAFANWTNLSETTFLLKPTKAGADYRVRIFTVARELPFAGHPTLGTCHVWLEAGGKPKGEEVVQECGAGLVRLRRDGKRLAFAAPPLKRSGAVESDVLAQIARNDSPRLIRSQITAINSGLYRTNCRWPGPRFLLGTISFIPRESYYLTCTVFFCRVPPRSPFQPTIPRP